jgi:hypothetical protein
MKKRLSGALHQAKEAWQANKRRKMEEHVLAGPSNLNTTPEPAVVWTVHIARSPHLTVNFR